MEQHLAALQGAYQQVNERLRTIDSRLATFQADTSALRTEISASFRWMAGIMLGSWITLLGTLLLRH